MLRERYLNKGEKPDRVMVWRPAPVPAPDVAYLMLPSEFGGNVLWDWAAGATSSPFAGSTGTPVWVGPGPALRFVSANTQYVPLSKLVSMPGGGVPFTMACLVRTTSTATNIYAYTEGSTTEAGTIVALGISNATAGKPFFFVRSSAATDLVTAHGATSFNDGRWHWLYGTYSGASGATGYLYLDGREDGSNGQTRAATTSAVRATCGALGRAGYALGWEGDIAACIGWRRVLSAAEVAAHYADPYMWFREPRRAWAVPAGGGTAWTKALTDALSLSDARAAGEYHALTDALSLSDARTAGAMHALGESLSLIDAVVKGGGKTLAEALSLTDGRTSGAHHALAELLSYTDARTAAAAKVLAEALGLTDTRTVGAHLALTDALPLTDARAAGIAHVLAETLTLIDTRSAGTMKAIAEALGLTDVFGSELNPVGGALVKALAETLTLTDSLTTHLAALLVVVTAALAGDPVAGQLLADAVSGAISGDVFTTSGGKA